jgi:hypothetical protein
MLGADLIPFCFQTDENDRVLIYRKEYQDTSSPPQFPPNLGLKQPIPQFRVGSRSGSSRVWINQYRSGNKLLKAYSLPLV